MGSKTRRESHPPSDPAKASDVLSNRNLWGHEREGDTPEPRGAHSAEPQGNPEVSEYRATMPGTPQRGQLLSPRQTEKASWRVLTAEQEFTTRQKDGGCKAPSFWPPLLDSRPCTQKPPEPLRPRHLEQGLDPSRHRGCLPNPALEGLCTEHHRQLPALASGSLPGGEAGGRRDPETRPFL